MKIEVSSFCQIAFQKNIGLNWECFQCKLNKFCKLLIKPISCSSPVSKEPCRDWQCEPLLAAWVMQEPRCSRASFRALMVPQEQAECWDVGVGQGLCQCWEAAASACELLRMVGNGQRDIFSLQCPSRGAVNILHHCLFKRDGGVC